MFMRENTEIFEIIYDSFILKEWRLQKYAELLNLILCQMQPDDLLLDQWTCMTIKEDQHMKLVSEETVAQENCQAVQIKRQ